MGKFLAVLVALLPLPALATDVRGNIVCTIADDTANLNFHALFSYRGDKPLFGIAGALDLKASGTEVSAQTFALEHEHLIQQWFYDGDLRLQLNIPTPSGSVSLSLLTTKIGDTLDYQGTYDLEIPGADDIIERDGKATCKMD